MFDKTDGLNTKGYGLRTPQIGHYTAYEYQSQTIKAESKHLSLELSFSQTNVAWAIVS